jgi:hypothetical protein
MNSVALLRHADRWPPGFRKELTRVAKDLARSGAFIGIRFDQESGQLELFKVPARIPAPGPGGRKARAKLTHGLPVYKRGKNGRVWRGSLRVAKGGSWSACIELPAGGQGSLLTIERKGKGPRLLPSDAALVIPQGEAHAVVSLLDGLFAREAATRQWETR